MEGQSGIISIQWQILLVEAVSFLVLLTVLAKFVFKPIISFIEDRAIQIRLKFEDINQSRQEIEDMKAVYQRQLQTLEQDTEEIIQRAIKEGESQRDEIIVAARKETHLLMERAVTEIDRERSRALREIQKEIASLSIMAASRIIERSIDQATADQIVNQFIENELQEEKLRKRS